MQVVGCLVRVHCLRLCVVCCLFVGCGWLLRVDCCSLRVVCCLLLCVACCLLFGVNGYVFAAFAVRRSLFVVCCVLFVVCCVLRVGWRLVVVMCCSVLCVLS